MPPQTKAPISTESEIHQLEERLRQAMLQSDVVELDVLIDDRLLFIGPDGAVYSKEADLELHRSGAERVTRLEVEELKIEMHPSAAIVALVANMDGAMHGQAFEGRFRYLRTWVLTTLEWRIVAGSVCLLPS